MTPFCGHFFGTLVYQGRHAQLNEFFLLKQTSKSQRVCFSNSFTYGQQFLTSRTVVNGVEENVLLVRKGMQASKKIRMFKKTNCHQPNDFCLRKQAHSSPLIWRATIFCISSKFHSIASLNESFIGNLTSIDGAMRVAVKRIDSFFKKIKNCKPKRLLQVMCVQHEPESFLNTFSGLQILRILY